jgi:predicted dehydrogenase
MCPTDTSDALSVLMVGCGAIAGGYDEAVDGREVLTHAGAYACHPNFMVAACVDPDEARRRAFMDHWGVGAGFGDLAAWRASGIGADVASVCVPTAAHEQVLGDLLEAPIKAVFAEKPLTGDPAASRRLVDAYEAGGRALAVNYTRRWDDSMERLRRSIRKGEWGRVQSVTGHYVKGILNCGSHLIDILNFLVGPVAPIAVLQRHPGGAGPGDPTLDAQLVTAEGAPVYLVGGDEKAFFTFEADLMMERGHIVIEDLGLTLRRRPVGAHEVYPSTTAPERGSWEETGLTRALERAVDNLYNHIRGGAALLSDGRSALAAEEACAALIDMAGGAQGESR